MGTQKTAEEVMKNAGKFTEEVLVMAEERGLTLRELFSVAEGLKNKVIREQCNSEYKSEKPVATTTGQ